MDSTPSRRLLVVGRALCRTVARLEGRVKTCRSVRRAHRRATIALADIPPVGSVRAQPAIARVP